MVRELSSHKLRDVARKKKRRKCGHRHPEEKVVEDRGGIGMICPQAKEPQECQHHQNLGESLEQNPERQEGTSPADTLILDM